MSDSFQQFKLSKNHSPVLITVTTLRSNLLDSKKIDKNLAVWWMQNLILKITNSMIVSQDEIWTLSPCLFSVLFLPISLTYQYFQQMALFFFCIKFHLFTMTFAKPQTFFCNISMKLKPKPGFVSKYTYFFCHQELLCSVLLILFVFYAVWPGSAMKHVNLEI